MKAEHKWIESKNGRVHYWLSNNGCKNNCIVFTHGLTADHTMFEKQVEFFADKYCALCWDIPLHGLSRPYSNFTYENTAVELKTILDIESIDKVVLVGMSMGGYPCQEFASLYPDYVEGFIALDTTPFGIEYYSKSDMWWLKNVAPMAKWFPDSILRKSMARSVSKTDYSYKKMLEMLSPQTKEQIIEQMDIAYGVFAKENKDVNFNFPVLLLLGDNDKTGKVKVYNKMWSKKTGYPLHMIKNAAHFSNGDNPVQVNQEIQTFISRLYPITREER